MRTRIYLYSLIFLVATTPAVAATLSGRVIDVSRGDRLVLMGPGNALYQVRLAGIEAPAPKQPYGKDARTRLKTLLLGRFIDVAYEYRKGARPIVGKVTYGGADMGLRQLLAGLARFRPDPILKDTDRRLYLQAQAKARQAHQGIWRTPIPR